MSNFWILDEPRDTEATHRRAEWNEDADIRYQQITCPLNPGHRRADARLTPASLVLPDLDPYDFVWSTWTCLVQRSVLRIFEQAGLTGFKTLPAEVRFKRSRSPAPEFCELVATGSAGSLSAESGFRVLRTCPGCGLQETTRIVDPEKVIDESEWDGTDFFQLLPGMTRLFVTGNVARTLVHSSLKGWEILSLHEMRGWFDVVFPG